MGFKVYNCLGVVFGVFIGGCLDSWCGPWVLKQGVVGFGRVFVWVFKDLRGLKLFYRR